MKCGKIVNDWMEGLSLPAYAFKEFQGKKFIIIYNLMNDFIL